MTEIENILNGIPYDFLVENPDSKYKNLKLIRILSERINDGVVLKEALLIDKQDQFHRCVWALDFLHNQVIIEELIPISALDALSEVLKSLKINDTTGFIERLKEDSR